MSMIVRVRSGDEGRQRILMSIVYVYECYVKWCMTKRILFEWVYAGRPTVI